MSSNLWVKQGIYDPTRRFAFTNIDVVPFTFSWAKTPITVKVGETVELPHHLAVLATTQLVDKIMLDEINAKTEKLRAINPMYIAPNQAGSLGVPAAREPYETKILKELPKRDDGDAQLNIIRSQFKEEMSRDLKAENSPHITKASEIGVTNINEFEGINLPQTAK